MGGKTGSNWTSTATGGRRKRRSLGRRHKKRGGQFGQVLKTALVPLALWGMQNKYSKKRGLSGMLPKLGGRRTRRRR